jgi:hypothetical protein
VATPKQFRRRGRWTLIIGTLLAALTVGAVMAFASSSTAGLTVNWDGKNGTNSDGTCKDFLDDSDLTPGPGQQGWLFILTSPATGSHELTTSFDPSFQTPSNPITGSGGGSIHFIVYTDAGAKLLSASATNGTAQSNLTVSHCVAAEKSKPTIETTPSSDVKVGDYLNDTATLADGSTSPAIGGTITFKLFAPNDTTCSDDPIYTDVVDVNGNGDYDTETMGDNSGGYKALTVGTYNWTADYSGDDNNEAASSGCGEEAFTVDQAAPTVLTTLHDPDHNPIADGSALDLGSTVHDSATVSGGGATPTGKVEFSFYSEEKCGGDPVAAGTVDLDSSGVADPSDAKGPLGPGSYGFTAHYDGDANYTTGDSLCEPFSVNKGDTTSSTTIVREDTNASLGIDPVPHVPLGTSVHDTATVGDQVGTFDLTGKLTYHFYKGLDCNKDNEVGTGEEVNVSADGTADASSSHGPLGAGDYSFNASYAGNGNYNASELSKCEPLTVDKGTLSIVTKIHDVNHNVVTFVPVNGIVHDTAHVTGQVTGFAPDLSKVGFAFYNTIDCTGDGVLAGNTGPDEVTAPDVRSGDSAALASGAYSYRARFAGDDNYNAVPGSSVACEPLSVRTFGKTMGFWGNVNGIARITNNGGYAANAVDIGRGAVVDTQAEAAKILPNQLNACGKGTPFIFTVGAQTATAACKLATGININSLNTLAAQTLALGYNIKLVSGFTGQTLGALGCTPVGSLTLASTVNDVFDAAKALIDGSSTGGSTTQSQIGLMNTLLGCINAEA